MPEESEDTTVCHWYAGICSIENAMNMLNIDAYVQMLFKGIVIVAIIWLDCYTRKRKREAV